MPAGLGGFLLFVNNLTQPQSWSAAVTLTAAKATGAAAEEMAATGGAPLTRVHIAAAAAEEMAAAAAVPLTGAHADGSGFASMVQPVFGPATAPLTQTSVFGYGHVINQYVPGPHAWGTTPSPSAYGRWAAGGGPGYGPLEWRPGGPPTTGKDEWVARTANVLAILMSPSKK